MKQEVLNKMREKALVKKDGVYSLENCKYLVYKKSVAAYADYFGNVRECVCGLSVSKGKVERYEVEKILRGYLKQLKNNS